MYLIDLETKSHGNIICNPSPPEKWMHMYIYKHVLTNTVVLDLISYIWKKILGSGEREREREREREQDPYRMALYGF